MSAEQRFSPDSNNASPSPKHSPIIKRAPKTYGKRRDHSLDEMDASFSTLDQSFSSDTSNVYRTAPTEVDEEIPPSSDASFSSPVSLDSGSPTKESLSVDFFGWKRWAKEGGSTPPQSKHPIHDASEMVPSSPLEQAHAHMSRTTSSSSSSPARSPPPDPYLSSVAPPYNSHMSVPLVDQGVSPPTSFSKSKPLMPTRVDGVRGNSPDFHCDNPMKTTPTTPMSPISVPTSVDTSKAHSSTPPTSDNEIHMQVSVKSLPKSKTVTRRTVPPLDFQEDHTGKLTSMKELSKRKKTKAPTKKDDRERIKGQARIIAEQPVSIQKCDNRNKYRVEQLFLNVKDDTHGSNMKSHLSSDPIVPFSSPSLQRDESSPHDPAMHAIAEIPSHADSPTRQISRLNIGNVNTKLFHTKDTSQQYEERKKKLADLKRRFVEDKAKRQSHTTFSDEELDIIASQEMRSVIKREDVERKSGRKSISKSQKKHLVFAGTKVQSPVKDSVSSSDNNTSRRLAESASSHQSLSRYLAEQVRKQNMEAVKQKEEEWVRRGGRSIKDLPDSMGLTKQERLSMYAKKALQTLGSIGQDGTENKDEEHDTDISDEEWVPQESKYEQSDQGSDDDCEEQMKDDNETRNDDDVLEEASIIKTRRYRQVVVDSDDEDVDRNSPVPRCSSEESAENDENNKENDTRLMFDRSEDKENKAVVRHPLLREDSSEKELSVTPPQVSHGDEFDDMEEDRVPLGVLPRKDHLISPVRPRNLSRELAELQRPSISSPPSFPASISLVPVFSDDRGMLPFSQFPDDELEALSDGPGAGNSTADNSFAPTVTSEVERNRNAALEQKPPTKKSLGLTQDVKLQPAFQVDEKLLKQADTIFEKEQEYLVEAANKKPQNQPELYVNDLGFLTQTRPETCTPVVYKPPLTSERSGWSPGASDLGVSQRTPLRTLSLTAISETDSPEHELKRLKKGGSAASARPIQNAFALLSEGAANIKRIKEGTKLLGKSEFIEAEAEESDEDDIFGVVRNNDDEEDEHEDQDRTLEALVDDQEMDDSTLAADLVIKKFKEQEEVDDAQLEQYHKAVVNGEIRKKRRHGGLGLDDSGDESDESEENRRIRRGMHKKQKIDRGDITALAGNDATKAFYIAYEQGVIDEDDSFAHLQPSESQEENTSKMDDPDDEASFVTRAEIQQRARELVGRRHQINPDDVSWIDGESDGEGPVRVKPAATRSKIVSRNRELDIAQGETIQMADMRELSSEADYQRNRQRVWYNQEKHSKHGGIARRTEGAAVTGHSRGKSKTKSGGGSLRGRPESAASDQGRETQNKLRAQASILAGVDRSTRFG